MSLSRSEMQTLRGLLGKLSVNPAPQKKKTSKRRRKTNKKSNIPAGFTRGPNAAGVNPSQGEIVVTRSELVGSVAMAAAGTGTGSINMYPDSSSFAWLHKLRSAFDRIEWMSATLCWKPFVGTQASGSVAFGVDWNSQPGTTTRAKVQACTPVYESPVWQSGSLSLPNRYLMTRKVYLLESSVLQDKQPGVIVWALAGVVSPKDKDASIVFGEIWCTYKVRLSGTTA